jgi:hypothetical protein
MHAHDRHDHTHTHTHTHTASTWSFGTFGEQVIWIFTRFTKPRVQKKEGKGGKGYLGFGCKQRQIQVGGHHQVFRTHVARHNVGLALAHTLHAAGIQCHPMAQCWMLGKTWSMEIVPNYNASDRVCKYHSMIGRVWMGECVRACVSE